MAKKLILYGMGIRKGRLRGWAWGVVLLCYSLLLSPLYAGAEMCTEIDYNKPTIAAGWGDMILGLKEDGTVVGEGVNISDFSDWINIKAISAGIYQYHALGLKEDGAVVAVGGANVSDWTDIKAIAAGAFHEVGLKEDGTVVTVTRERDFFGREYWSHGDLNVPHWTNIKAIAAGWGNTIGLKEDGTVVAVGDNSWGKSNVSDWTNIKAIAAGFYHTVGLKEDGTVVATGWGGYGELNVSSWTNIKAIAAGQHTVGLKEDGTVVATWGNEDVAGWSNITAIAAGYADTVGLKNDGTAVAVGWNQVNVSDWTNIRQPSRGLSLPPTNLTASDTPYDLGGSTTLAWTKSVDDGAGLNSVSAYNIYRYSATDGNIRILTSLPAGAVSYIDNSTIDTNTYYYFAKAFDSTCNKESRASNIATGQSVNNLTTMPDFISTLPGISPQLLNSLMAKAENAVKAFDNVNKTATESMLNALLNEISAQAGKNITADATATLITYVQNLINYVQAY